MELGPTQSDLDRILEEKILFSEANPADASPPALTLEEREKQVLQAFHRAESPEVKALVAEYSSKAPDKDSLCSFLINHGTLPGAEETAVGTDPTVSETQLQRVKESVLPASAGMGASLDRASRTSTPAEGSRRDRRLRGVHFNRNSDGEEPIGHRPDGASMAAEFHDMKEGPGQLDLEDDDFGEMDFGSKWCSQCSPGDVCVHKAGAKPYSHPQVETSVQKVVGTESFADLSQIVGKMASLILLLRCQRL
jgi:hypothetical protein